jgi:flagellar hook-associated protein 1 FlgK
MGGLNTTLLVATQGLSAAEAALDSASNNISNANTPGYTREQVQLSENPEYLSGDTVTGGGVTVNGVASVRAQLLNLQIQQQTSLQSSVNTQSSNLQSIQDLFSSTGGDIGSMLNAFSSSLAALSANPANSSVQDSVVTAGQNLAQSFNSTASGLQSAQTAADQQVTQTVAQINSLTSQIAQLNSQLTPTVMSQQNGGTIEDQRDQLVQQLSGLVGISITQSSDGEVITTANGSPLVMGNQSFALQTTTGSDGFQQVLDANGNNITASIQGGQLGGAIQTRDQIIPGFLDSLNALATQFADSMNTAQSKGTDSTGATGQPFFSIPSSGSAAAGLSVALTSGSQVAISSDGSTGSNGNIANLLAAVNGNMSSGQTPADAYGDIVYDVGSTASNATAQSTALGDNITQLTNQQSSVSGVNLDEETTNLIRYQTAYEAAARVVSTIQLLNTVTLEMGTSQSY